jgi:predicted NBD/HSP70 family sugar kinase
MLFDLRGRGRRRTVRAVYLGLAILFGLSFIGFGVGTGLGGGGVFEGLFGNKENAGGARYGKQVAEAEKRTRLHPSEAAAWAALTEARFHNASGSEYYDETKQQFTAKGKEQLTKVVDAWSRYVALKPQNPTLTIAYDMVRVFGEEGLNEPSEAVSALQLVIPSKPASVTLYGDLAKFAYQAKNVSVGDLAAAKTISLTPTADRKKVEEELAELKRNPTGNPANNSYTGTTNGKVFTVKVGEKGQGTILKTSPAPTTTAKTSSTKK